MTNGSKTSTVFKPVNILRYPRLDTVLMVEKAIRDCKDYPTRTQLWKSLPKKTMYQTFTLILDYLVHSHKIVIEKDQIIWVWDSAIVEKYLKRKDLHWIPSKR